MIPGQHDIDELKDKHPSRMNKEELEYWRNHNENKINHHDVSGAKRNYVHVHPQNTYEHEKRKFEECWRLRQEDKQFVTEARFKDRDLRADIYVLDTDQIIEIETSSYKVEERKDKYPDDAHIILLEEEK